MSIGPPSKWRAVRALWDPIRATPQCRGLRVDASTTPSQPTSKSTNPAINQLPSCTCTFRRRTAQEFNSDRGAVAAGPLTCLTALSLSCLLRVRGATVPHNFWVWARKKSCAIYACTHPEPAKYTGRASARDRKRVRAKRGGEREDSMRLTMYATLAGTAAPQRQDFNYSRSGLPASNPGMSGVKQRAPARHVGQRPSPQYRGKPPVTVARSSAGLIFTATNYTDIINIGDLNTDRENAAAPGGGGDSATGRPPEEGRRDGGDLVDSRPEAPRANYQPSNGGGDPRGADEGRLNTTPDAVRGPGGASASADEQYASRVASQTHTPVTGNAVGVGAQSNEQPGTEWRKPPSTTST
ncbi:hypothetical protein B0H19DRAFT_1287043 [Mycena capillaripes]|nr:hypothetical protein B0H19DRAFT_1287043 [Mycena capillaripes]